MTKSDRLALIIRLATRNQHVIPLNAAQSEIEEEVTLTRNPDDVGEIVDEEKINIPSRALVSQSLDMQEVDSARSAAIEGKGEDYFLLTAREKAQAQADLAEYRNEKKRFWIVPSDFFSPVARLTA